jgi:SpoVK/Ycf46/Vps4 family AAA+-type ATPase
MKALDVVELLLTAEIYNNHENLTEDDLPKPIRKIFWDSGAGRIHRPLVVTIEDIEKYLGGVNAEHLLRELPFIDVNPFNNQCKLTVLDLGAKWYIKNANKERMEQNPVIAYYFENYDSVGVSYEKAREQNLPKESDREWLTGLISRLEEDEETSDMLKLVKIISPEDVRTSFEDIALTSAQMEEVHKIETAIKNREFLKEIGLYDIGKLLFIGPPGTGKTSTARALCSKLAIPLVEVRLSMITSQYLGETSKNIEKVFELAKRINPCILFIDEFDYVAKTRTSDEHAAVKRAVNTLLKAIDEINLVEDGVLLIAATNHPQLLDQAAWRRFDNIVEFPYPGPELRERILNIILSKVKGDFDLREIAHKTEGFTGADLRLVVREAVLKSLLDGRRYITQLDLLNSVEEFRKRLSLKES